MLQTHHLDSIHPLIRSTARRLRADLGAAAVAASHQAIRRMRDRGDEEGLHLWLELHAVLVLMEARPAGRKPPRRLN